MSLFDLPAELIERILTFLPSIDLVSSALTCSLLYTVVKNSVVIKYLLAAAHAAIQDNGTPLSCLERHQLLQTREDAWYNLKPTARRTIREDFPSGGLYDLANGIYVLGDETRTFLRYLRLPSADEETPEWQRFDGSGRTMVDFGMSVDEHDLIAVVTLSVIHGSVEAN
jgi:hypothetical protein